MFRKDISEYVISSRVRLARNLKDYAFPSKIKGSAASIIAEKVKNALPKESYTFRRVSELGTLDCECLKEKHLISKELVRNLEYGAVALRADEIVSIMIIEEDHIREQCILKGFSLEDAFNIIDGVDDRICNTMNIAFDDTVGFLTACPTNLGTGMRASVMMFLPALSITNSLQGAISELTKFGITVRGVYGEGTNPEGYRYQISNSTSLGFSEQEILSMVSSAATWLAAREEQCRADLYDIHNSEFIDGIYRAWGTLTNAYKMSCSEFMRLISQVQLGVYLDVIRVRSIEALERLIVEAQPATLTVISGKNLVEEQRDIFRADYVARALKGQRQA